MPIGNTKFTISHGRDITMKLISPDGKKVDLSNLMMVNKPKPVYEAIDVTRLDGKHFHADLPKCYEGDFEAVRKDGEIDAVFDSIFKKWREQGVFDFGTVYLYITEGDGSQTIERYTNVSLKLNDGGSFGEKEVRIKIGFTASDKD